MDDAPEIMQRTAQPYAGISAWVTMAAVGSVADRIPEIFGWLGGRGVAPAGPPFFRYHVIDMERQLLLKPAFRSRHRLTTTARSAAEPCPPAGSPS